MSTTSQLGFIVLILSLKHSVLYFPTVSLVAIICLFIFVISTISESTNINLPILDLDKASTTYPPTPPKPNTNTVELFNFSTFGTELSRALNDPIDGPQILAQGFLYAFYG